MKKDQIDILLENLKYDIIGMEDGWLIPSYNTEKIYKLLKKEYKGAESIMENKKDMVNRPNHYTNRGIECIDEMIHVFGKQVVMDFCLCNVWKYRYRALAKNGQEDIEKSDWYMEKYLELKEDIDKAAKAKSHKVKCNETGEILESAKEACEKYGVHHSNIVDCCNKR